MESPGAGGPAANVARRGPVDVRERRRRSYPLLPDGDNRRGDGIALAATRALLRALTREEAAQILRTAVDDLGGVVVPARLATDDALPQDISLGVGEPAVVEAAAGSPADERLRRHLTELVNDAHTVANRSDLIHHQERVATVDALTGAATRREIGRRLGRTDPGDAVCMLDLDGLKQLNDTRGHAAGDDALRDLGRLLRESIRPDDFVGRYGGDEFVLVLRSTDLASARDRMASIAGRWGELDNQSTTASIGVAEVGEHGGAGAAKAADAALYRAKRSGRDRIELAVADDYPAKTPPALGAEL